MLGAAYSEQLEGVGPVRPRPVAERTPVERRLATDLAADLSRYQPAAMLVLRQDFSEPGWGGAKRFDYLGYFLADPQFTRILADYRDAGDFGDYSLLLREGVTIPLEPGHAATSSGSRGAIGLGNGRVRWMIDPLGLVLFGLVFGVGWSLGKAPAIERRCRDST